MRPLRSAEQNLNVVWAHAAIEALVDAGLKDIIVSPGSRSTPLVAAVVDDPRLRDHSVIDERSAAFCALGMARASQRPVALICTSGTAAANYLPAVCEAFAAGVPLVVMTADRPPRLRSSGASQAMRQVDLYGSHVRWSHDLGLPSDDPAELRYVRSIARRAFAVSRDESGPVHINFPFEKPLEPTATSATASGPMVFGGHRGEVYQRSVRSPDPHDITEAVRLIESCARPVIVVGSTMSSPAWSQVLDDVARRIGAPIIAEATSQLRFGPLADSVVAGDVILSNRELAGTLRPDLVLRLGRPAVNWPVIRWLEDLDAREIVVSQRYDCDPEATADMIFISDEGAFLDSLRRRLPDSDVPSKWRRDFQDHGRRASQYLAERFESAPLVDGSIAHDVARFAPANSSVVLSSSMPLRDFEAFALPRTDPLTVHCNRGLNGIDGVVSTAYGVAAASDDPTILLIGDVAMAHDLAALQLGARLGIGLTIVLVDNAGGAIFEHLPVAGMEPMFTRHFTTETNLDWGGCAQLFGASVIEVTNRAELQEQLSVVVEHTRVLVLKTSRKQAKEVREDVLSGFEATHG